MLARKAAVKLKPELVPPAFLFANMGERKLLHAYFSRLHCHLAYVIIIGIG